MGLTVIPPGGGEVVGDKPGRRVEILSDRDPLHATLSRFGPGMEGADLHVHQHHTDFFYVLEGELTVRLGAETQQVRVPAGNLAWVPPDVVHGFRNASDADMRYLNFHAPGCRFADYMRSLRDGDRSSTTSTTRPPTAAARPRRRTSPPARRSPRASRCSPTSRSCASPASAARPSRAASTGWRPTSRSRATSCSPTAPRRSSPRRARGCRCPPATSTRSTGCFLNVTAPSSTA